MHIGVGLLSGLIAYLIHFRIEFSLSVFIGNLLPDAIKFGFTALKQGTLSIFSVNMKDEFYRNIAAFTYSSTNWFSFGFFLSSVLIFLYHYHYIKKKKMEEYEELYAFLLIGIITHLIMDVLIIEKSVWF